MSRGELVDRLAALAGVMDEAVLSAAADAVRAAASMIEEDWRRIHYLNEDLLEVRRTIQYANQGGVS